MEKRINIIKNISFTKCTDVIFYQGSLSGKVQIQTNEWKEINTSAAPATLSVKEEQTTAGPQFTVDISFALKSPLIETSPVILKVDLCDGETILIGSKELPVRMESTTQLITKRIEVSHKSWHFPFVLIS